MTIEELIRRYRAGESCYALARAVGVSPSTVWRRLRRHGIVTRNQSEAALMQRGIPIEDAELARRYRAGETMQSIAAQLGVSQSSISRRINELGIPTPMNRWRHLS